MKESKSTIDKSTITKILNKKISECLLLGIDKKTINNIIEKLQKYSTELDSQNNYENTIRMYFNNKITKVINAEAKNPKEAAKMINRYINILFKKPSSYESAVNEICEISNLINEYQIFSNPDVIIEVYNSNEILNDIIKAIAIESDKNQENGIMEDNNIALLTELYRSENDINIEEIPYIEENIQSSSDFKMYLKEIGKYKVLTASEEKELLREAQKGNEEARDKVIKHNLKLVVSIASRFRHRKLSVLDLVQEGNIGLIKAIEKFNVNKKIKFSTYASYWIRQKIIRSMQNYGRTIRIPVHEYQYISTYKDAYDKAIANGKIPSNEEIAKELDITPEHARVLYEMSNDILSSDGYMSDCESKKGDDALSKIIKDNTINIEEDYIKEELGKNLQELFKKAELTEREILVLNLYYGFANKGKLTYSAIGEMLGVKRQTVEANEKNAIMKLRRCPGITKFAMYLDNPEKAAENLKQSNVTNRVEKRSSANIEQTYIFKKELAELTKHSSIYDWFSNYAKTEVNKAIEFIPSEYKKIIVKKYGQLYETSGINRLSKKETNKFIVALNKINALLVNKEDQSKGITESMKIDEQHEICKSLYMRFPDYSMKEVNNVIETLEQEKIDILNQSFNKNYQNMIPLDSINIDGEKKYKRAKRVLNVIASRIKTPLNRVSSILKPIYSYFDGYTPEEVDSVIESLPKVSIKSLNILYAGNYKEYKEVKLDSLKKKIILYEILDRIYIKLKEEKLNSQEKITKSNEDASEEQSQNMTRIRVQKA